MPDLRFEITNAEALGDAATPTVGLSVAITNRGPERVIHSVLLRCQISIECARRPYTHDEQQRLYDLFGEPDRWDETLRTMTWLSVTETLPGFEDRATYLLHVCCAYDRNVAAAKYFHALQTGCAPLSVLFGGSVFYYGAGERLQVLPIPWDREARFRLPIQLWKDVTRRYYPTSEWLDKFNVSIEDALSLRNKMGAA